jgi:hypothetical protein
MLTVNNIAISRKNGPMTARSAAKHNAGKKDRTDGEKRASGKTPFGDASRTGRPEGTDKLI